MTRKTILLGVMLMVMGVVAKGQETMQLTLEQAQQYAIEHNYTLQNASLDVKKAEAAKWEALSSMLPQVNAQFDYSCRKRQRLCENCWWWSQCGREIP